MRKKKIKKEKQEELDARPMFKLKIDFKTTITVRSKAALEMWLQKYPNAEIIAA